ncbi:hypothetical protein SAMN02745157_3649 [Kaistia soli DSM 19436]|uniref:Uncharacterized protein n=1 Tax=Kaistia soli DSM 19436 TaxID=1122133 RepID=A0A1M5H771_9HYPH|nr:hypothetical protein [Kaistia soli]SHG11784.1 hypothetical protein SAMN02745157_3649 [Kaistia soli DSM 19436]
MADNRTPLTPWAVIQRLEEQVEKKRGARLTWETSFILLAALRAYVANEKREALAPVICMRTNAKRTPCEPVCGRCVDLGYAFKRMMRGEPNEFGNRGNAPQSGPAICDEAQGFQRPHDKLLVGKIADN